MDPILRDTMFAGLTVREIAEAVTHELRRREYCGCMFAFPAGNGGLATFASATPEDTIGNSSAAEQLMVFAQVAALAVGEVRTKRPPEDNDPPLIN